MDDNSKSQRSLRERVEYAFASFAAKASVLSGSMWAFASAVGVIVLWGVSGPLFGFSDTWQLVINTSTTIITFLMVFLIQHAQNQDMRAVQMKLNELISAIDAASNQLIDVEDLSDQEREKLALRYHHFVAKSERNKEPPEADAQQPKRKRRPHKRARNSRPVTRRSLAPVQEHPDRPYADDEDPLQS